MKYIFNLLNYIHQGRNQLEKVTLLNTFMKIKKIELNVSKTETKTRKHREKNFPERLMDLGSNHEDNREENQEDSFEENHKNNYGNII